MQPFGRKASKVRILRSRGTDFYLYKSEQRPFKSCRSPTVKADTVLLSVLTVLYCSLNSGDLTANRQTEIMQGRSRTAASPYSRVGLCSLSASKAEPCDGGGGASGGGGGSLAAAVEIQQAAAVVTMDTCDLLSLNRQSRLACSSGRQHQQTGMMRMQQRIGRGPVWRTVMSVFFAVVATMPSLSLVWAQEAAQPMKILAPLYAHPTSEPACSHNLGHNSKFRLGRTDGTVKS